MSGLDVRVGRSVTVCLVIGTLSNNDELDEDDE